MKITVKREALLDEVSLVRRAAERKTTIPTLAYARLVAAGGVVTIACTDIESAIVSAFDATVETPGTVLVPAKTLHGMLRAGSDDDVTLAQVKQQITFTCGRFAAKLQTLPVDDFPIIQMAPASEVLIPAGPLKAAIARVKMVADHATGKHTRTYETAVLFDFAGEALTLVSTDGGRLALSTVACPQSTLTATLLVPRIQLGDLQALIDSAPGDSAVTVARDHNRVFFGVGDRMLVATQMQDTFPPYRRVIPKLDGARRVAVSGAALQNCLKRVMQVSTPLSEAVEISIDAQQLTAHLESHDLGSATEAVPVTLKGEPWDTRFMGRYLLDFLAAADAGEIVLEQKGHPQAAVLSAGPDYRYVLMPVSL
jgi:DNA polymerase-3 subunit beta